ncbi:hypothetical protein EU545_01400 [Candidatus Thorarchaeota archaeon]|nr:MAG: hypothetical protein EU545_01400 [Candidatus Thorarchaeota archaeon]
MNDGKDLYSRKYMDVDASSLSDPVVVMGLPGIANVGRIAVETLAQIVDAQLFMELFSPDNPPKVFVKDGLSRFPKSSVHLYRSAPDEDHDLLIITADFQPASGRGVFEYADFMAQQFITLGVKQVFALAAYEQDYKKFFASYPSPPRIFLSASEKELLSSLMKIPGTVKTENGVITGANGIVPAWASTMYNMESACLLGETLGMIKMDYRSAQKVLGALCSHLGLVLDLGVLDDGSAKVEKFIEWAKSEMETREAVSESDEHPSDRYIG